VDAASRRAAGIDRIERRAARVDVGDAPRELGEQQDRKHHFTSASSNGQTGASVFTISLPARQK
jgi:hypothetical protein